MQKIKIITASLVAATIQSFTVHGSEAEIPANNVPFELSIGKLIVTDTALLTKQTGQHKFYSSKNNFEFTGTIDEAVEKLKEINVILTILDDKMIFYNKNNEQISFSIESVGRSGKNYESIEQRNTSISLNNKTATFSLSENSSSHDLGGFRFRIITDSIDNLSKSEQPVTINNEFEGTNKEKILNLSNFIEELNLNERNETNWSNSIEFSDINHVMTNGGLTISFSSNEHSDLNIWIDMSNIETLEQFFDSLIESLKSKSIRVVYFRS